MYRWLLWDFLPSFSLVWLGVGGCIAGIGGICLLIYYVQFSRCRNHDRRLMVKIVLLALLLISNLPAAWICMGIGMRLMAPMDLD
jgi:hypothetical protein